MSKKTFSKLLSEKFQISRKKAEDLIKNKKVLLNDNIESRPYLVVQEKDIVSLNEPIEKKVNLILFHKPKGCITSRSDEKIGQLFMITSQKNLFIIIILAD